MVGLIFRVTLSASMNLILKLSHKHAQKFVSMVILNPFELTIKVNHLNH